MENSDRRQSFPLGWQHKTKGVAAMKFTFTDKKVHIPQKVHDYAEKKIGKLDRYFKADSEAAVTFSVEKNRNKVEITVRSGSMIFRISESTADMFASIDAAVALLERQIRKNKTRLEKKLRSAAFEHGAETGSFVPEEPEEEFEIVRTKKFPLKPMTTEEAILQMNMLGHSFFAFKNLDEGEGFAVVYQRKGGGYGLIVDED